MDMIKIGRFLAQLRRECDLTQEQLGEEIGVTNKTISRWENGNYLPPVEMLQILSEKYGVSINEILSGERLSEEKFKEKAEENIALALDNSIFTAKEKKDYFEKKWRKDHCVEMIFEMLILIALAVVGAIFMKELCILASLICIAWSWWINNRMEAYAESHIETNPDKIDKDKKQ